MGQQTRLLGEFQSVTRELAQKASKDGKVGKAGGRKRWRGGGMKEEEKVKVREKLLRNDTGGCPLTSIHTRGHTHTETHKSDLHFCLICLCFLSGIVPVSFPFYLSACSLFHLLLFSILILFLLQIMI